MCAGVAGRSIPYYASTMVAREADVDLLEQLIEDPGARIITIAGIAGVGKTRLCAHVARRMEEKQPDSVVFVSLATVRDPALVLAEIGKAFGLQSDDLVEAIHAHLANWQGLLVVDNFEQVIQAAPDIGSILPYNPDVTILITSQRPLQIEGERVIRLDPLAIPAPDAPSEDLLGVPSVQLLVDRVGTLDATLSGTLHEGSTTEAMAEICRRLDGIPLAIELAASRLVSLSPEVVLAQMEHGREILSSQRRDRPDRQRTMHAAIDWSYQLLPEDSQRIFLWLGPFTAGFDLGMVENLTQHLGLRPLAIDSVSELMNLSLVRRESGGANPWYSMLESMREFCLAELNAIGERDAAQAFVADHVMQMADKSDAALTGPDSAEWFQILDRELHTVRSSVAWALAHSDPIVPIRVANGMWRFLEQEGRWQEGVSWIERAEEWRESVPEDLYIAGMITKMTMMEEGRDLPGAMATAKEIEELLRGKDLPELEVVFLLRSGSVVQDQQQLDEASDYFHRALEIAEAHNIGRNATIARANIGIVAYLRGDYETAEANFLKVKDDMEAIGDKSGMTNILSNLAATASSSNHPERALGYLDEAIAISEELGLRRSFAYARLNQCSAYLALDDLASALAATEEAIELARSLDNRMLETVGLVNLAEISLLKDDLTASGTYMLRALELVTPSEGSRSYVEVGLILADALSRINRVSDAAAILAKAHAFADEIDFSFDWGNKRRIALVSARINEYPGNRHQEEERGRLWTTEEFVRNLVWFARRVAALPSGVMVKVPAGAGMPTLTARENEILQLMIEGQTTRTMAEQLSLSPRTITTHIGNMMNKLEVSSRAELVARTLNARTRDSL